jgi:hypothetical protein
MNQSNLIRDIISTYRKHGWQLRRVLMRADTRAEVFAKEEVLFKGARIDESPVDALWFSRASHSNREAWELRLVAETPYALFEVFEADESEELREAARKEMEARLREHVTRA